jgi:hypothetical protein
MSTLWTGVDHIIFFVWRSVLIVFLGGHGDIVHYSISLWHTLIHRFKITLFAVEDFGGFFVVYRLDFGLAA